MAPSVFPIPVPRLCSPCSPQDRGSCPPAPRWGEASEFAPFLQTGPLFTPLRVLTFSSLFRASRSRPRHRRFPRVLSTVWRSHDPSVTLHTILSFPTPPQHLGKNKQTKGTPFEGSSEPQPGPASRGSLNTRGRGGSTWCPTAAPAVPPAGRPCGSIAVTVPERRSRAPAAPELPAVISPIMSG